VFRPAFGDTIGLLIGCTICGTAGFWQLERAGQKTALFEAFDKEDALAPLSEPVADMAATEHLYRRFKLNGRYDYEHQILIDNMVHNGRNGYQVLTPLRVGSTSVLVNRGWIQADPDRALLPKVPVDGKMRVITGRLYRLPVAGLVLEGEAPRTGQPWPRRLSYPSADDISAHLGYNVRNYQILLDASETDGFLREWRPALMGPEKHLAYAIQWFMMAGTIIIIYIALTLKAARRKNHD